MLESDVAITKVLLDEQPTNGRLSLTFNTHHFYFVNLIRRSVVCNFCTASLSIFIFGVLYFIVIGLVGLCCKPQPLVIIVYHTLNYSSV